ncbi:MAG: GNAT family N-acetyltransferase [Lachnospiraceae bacterium]|nr:GNAT family N-acetyltransferase [Lachnospiraceae bacterium]
MSIRLVVPTIEHKESALDFKQEFIVNGESVINGSELLDQMEEYEEWLTAVTNNAHSETVNPEWVLTDTFFAVDDLDTIVGIVDLRHELKGFLLDFGHCGYSVRPTQRRQGYATEMLKLILNVAYASGMDQLQLSVERHNKASVKTIIANGGVYERTFELDGEPVDVYVIKTGGA